MAVFTVFFCGTGSNSFDFANGNYHSGELISTLARHCAGMEFVDWIIADGPGSGNLQEDEKFVKSGNYSEIEILRCYDQMTALEPQFKELRKTVYTTQKGQKKDRDIYIGQDWTATNFQSIRQLKGQGPFINWHHASLYRQLGGQRNQADYVQHINRAIRKFLNRA